MTHLVGFECLADERFVQHRGQLLPSVVVNDVEAMLDVSWEELWKQEHLLVDPERFPWKKHQRKKKPKFWGRFFFLSFFRVNVVFKLNFRQLVKSSPSKQEEKLKTKCQA